ncbi:hypothetical protein KKG22_05690 [Patescibacteria group bacterium]|nr:hypothetical protein [Patescibacteria group bacterium]
MEKGPKKPEELRDLTEQAREKMAELSELTKHFSPERAKALRELLEQNPGSGDGGVPRSELISLLQEIEETSNVSENFTGYKADPATGECEELSRDMFDLVHAAAGRQTQRLIEKMLDKLK